MVVHAMKMPTTLFKKRERDCPVCGRNMVYDPLSLLWTCTCGERQRPQVGNGDQYTMLRGPFELIVKPSASGMQWLLVNAETMVVVDLTGQISGPTLIEEAMRTMNSLDTKSTTVKQLSHGRVYFNNGMRATVYKEAPMD
jgi:hypothetical protein